jgi:hypothetical protein
MLPLGEWNHRTVLGLAAAPPTRTEATTRTATRRRNQFAGPPFGDGSYSDDVSGWGVFATVTGSATAALLGLLFVAVSIRVEPIARSAELRNRSAQTMTLLLTGLLISALLAVPDQPEWVLGVEYLILALTVTGVAVMLDRRVGTQSGSAVGRRLDATNPTSVTCSLLAIAAIVLILGHKAGIYVIVPAVIAVLVGGVVNAWLILVKLTD